MKKMFPKIGTLQIFTLRACAGIVEHVSRWRLGPFSDGWRIVSRSSKDSLQAVKAFRLIVERLHLNWTNMFNVKSLGINLNLLCLLTGNMDLNDLG